MFRIGKIKSSAAYLMLFSMLLILIPAGIFAQEPSIGGSFSKVPLQEVLLDIESKTDYHFYYLEEWVQNDTVTISYTDQTIDEVLTKLLLNSNLNYYVMESEKKVILIENAIIYDALPFGFFNELVYQDSIQKEVVENNLPLPTFYEDNLIETEKIYEVIKVGKSNLTNLKETYTLSGKVVNAITGQPIQDLAIRIQGTNISTITDSLGRYTLRLPPGFHEIMTSAMGTKAMQRGIIMYGDGRLDLQMEDGLEVLEEVIVEADVLKNVEDPLSGATEIVSEESKNIPIVLGERDVLQIAKALPGISSAGEGAAGLNVRGGKTDQNLVLLDDAVIYNPQHFFGIFQALNPFTTSSVSIYKGSIPVEFGGRISSVFDIQTKKGNDSEFAGEGSIGPVTANLALEFPVVKDKSSLIIGARGAYADWILRSLDNESLSNSEASFFDGIVKYEHQINEKNSVEITGYLSKDAFSITSDSLYNYGNWLVSAKWNREISEKTTSELLFANSNYQFGIDFDGSSNTDFDLDYAINETELKYNFKTAINDTNKLGYGLSAKYYSVAPGSIAPTGNESDVSPIQIAKEQALEGALFVGDEITIGENTVVNVGVRFPFFVALGKGMQRTYQDNSPRNENTVQDTISYDSWETIKNYGGPEFRLSARYLIAEDLSVKASLNNSYQFLHTLSNNTTVSPIDTWKLSDLNIKPQKGYQASLGVFKNFNDNMYELSLEGYYKQMKNVLDFKTGAKLFLNEHVETEVLQGEGKAYGVEFLLKKNRGDFNGWLGYTYSRSLFKFDSEFSEETINNGNYFPSNYDKPHDLSLVLNYRLTRRYSFSANFAYQTGRPITYPIGSFDYNNANYVLFSDRNEFRIPDYYRLDLGVNIEGNHKKNKLAHSFVTISVYNVLGRNNPYSVFFVTENGEVKALQSSIFAIPIPSITYNFKF